MVYPTFLSHPIIADAATVQEPSATLFSNAPLLQDLAVNLSGTSIYWGRLGNNREAYTRKRSGRESFMTEWDQLGAVLKGVEV